MSKATPKVLWRPQPGPQTALLTCPCNDILFGGARGGGKTSAMIGHFVARSARYGKDHQAVWFRRSLPEVEGAQVQMQALLPLLGAVYAVQARTWTMPHGATLKLRYLENDTDAGRYQGHEYATLYLDELGTFPRPEPIDMLRATLRSAAGVPTQMVASANPGGPGHAWIKARYLDPAPPMTPFTGSDGQIRVFIPSRVTDNPALLRADPTYIDRLKASGPPWLVRAWLEGDWNATLEGDLIKAEWLRNTYRELPPRDRWQRVLVSVDTAIKVGKDTDYTAMLVAAEVAGKVYLLDLAHGKWEFPALVARLKALGAQWSPSVVLVEDKGSGQSLLQQLNAEGWRFPLVPVTPTADKVTRMFTETGALEAGRVLLPEFADWVPGLVDECLTFPKGAHDDRVDALSQLLRYLREGVDLLAAWA